MCATLRARSCNFSEFAGKNAGLLHLYAHRLRQISQQRSLFRGRRVAARSRPTKLAQVDWRPLMRSLSMRPGGSTVSSSRYRLNSALSLAVAVGMALSSESDA